MKIKKTKTKKQENAIIEKKITKIYLVENCYGDPNRVYIGKTNNIVGRKTRHKETFGKQINYTYIDEISSLDCKDWKPLEGFWIQYFKFLGFEVLNKNKNGGGGPSNYNEEQKEKMRKPKNHGDKVSKALKGRKCTWIKKGIKSRPFVPILQYDLENNFIKEYKSGIEAALANNIDTGTLCACLKGRQKTCRGFRWRYKT